MLPALRGWLVLESPGLPASLSSAAQMTWAPAPGLGLNLSPWAAGKGRRPKAHLRSHGPNRPTMVWTTWVPGWIQHQRTGHGQRAKPRGRGRGHPEACHLCVPLSSEKPLGGWGSGVVRILGSTTVLALSSINWDIRTNDQALDYHL